MRVMTEAILISTQNFMQLRVTTSTKLQQGYGVGKVTTTVYLPYNLQYITHLFPTVDPLPHV